MNLYDAVLKADRERECAKDIGSPEVSLCRVCGKALRSDNETGFCRKCQQTGSGRRLYRMAVLPDRIPVYRANQRQWRKERFKKGLCANCTNPRVPDGKRCAGCVESDRRGSKAERDRRAKAGICWYCMNDVAPGKRRCRKHLAIDAARAAARRPAGIKADRQRSRELLARIPGAA